MSWNFKLTDSWYDGADKVEAAGKVPASALVDNSYGSGVAIGVEQLVDEAHVEAGRLVGQAPMEVGVDVPEAIHHGQLGVLLEELEERRPRHHVEQQHDGQQHETRVVLAEVQRPAAARGAAAGPLHVRHHTPTRLASARPRTERRPMLTAASTCCCASARRLRAPPTSLRWPTTSVNTFCPIFI